MCPDMKNDILHVMYALYLYFILLFLIAKDSSCTIMRNKSNKGLVLRRTVVWLLSILGKMEEKDVKPIVSIALM